MGTVRLLVPRGPITATQIGHKVHPSTLSHLVLSPLVKTSISATSNSENNQAVFSLALHSPNH